MNKQDDKVIKTDYIIRLKHYTDKVRETATDDGLKHKMAIISLLGYLEALETLIPHEQTRENKYD